LGEGKSRSPQRGHGPKGKINPNPGGRFKKVRAKREVKNLKTNVRESARAGGEKTERLSSQRRSV